MINQCSSLTTRNYLLTIIGQQSLNTAQLMWVKQNPPTIFIGGINLPFPVYDIVLPSGLLKMTHLVRRFTELKDCDFPVRYLSLTEGNMI